MTAKHISENVAAATTALSEPPIPKRHAVGLFRGHMRDIAPRAGMSDTWLCWLVSGRNEMSRELEGRIVAAAGRVGLVHSMRHAISEMRMRKLDAGYTGAMPPPSVHAEHGLTTEFKRTVAIAMGVCVATLNNWLARRTEPRDDLVAKLVAELNRSGTHFYRDNFNGVRREHHCMMPVAAAAAPRVVETAPDASQPLLPFTGAGISTGAKPHTHRAAPRAAAKAPKQPAPQPAKGASVADALALLPAKYVAMVQANVRFEFANQDDSNPEENIPDPDKVWHTYADLHRALIQSTHWRWTLCCGEEFDSEIYNACEKIFGK